MYGRQKKVSKPKRQNIRNLFFLLKKKKIREKTIRALFKPKRVSNLWNNSYIEYENK